MDEELELDGEIMDDEANPEQIMQNVLDKRAREVLAATATVKPDAASALIAR